MAVPAAGGRAYIRWVDWRGRRGGHALGAFPLPRMRRRGQSVAFSDVIAYVAARNGNRFGRGDAKIFADLSDKLRAGGTVDEAAGDSKYYRYHKEAYAAVFGPMVGPVETDGRTTVGIKGRFPLAAGYWYSHYDDFGNARSYGFRRKHLGHDIMARWARRSSPSRAAR